MVAHRRRAQCVGGGHAVRRAARARSRRRRLRHRLRARARHRRRRASREPRQPAPSRCSPAATTASIRRSMSSLADAILAQGAAVSEMPLGWEPRARDFPRRNRLISGLALGVVVVEAAQALGLADHRALRARTGPRGVRGAGLAARSARRRHQRPAQAGRDAGHRSRRRDRGAAADPRSAARTAAPRNPKPPAPAGEPGTDERARIIDLLGPTPVPIDDLVRLSGSSPAVVRDGAARTGTRRPARAPRRRAGVAALGDRGDAPRLSPRPANSIRRTAAILVGSQPAPCPAMSPSASQRRHRDVQTIGIALLVTAEPTPCRSCPELPRADR